MDVQTFCLGQHYHLLLCHTRENKMIAFRSDDHTIPHHKDIACSTFAHPSVSHKNRLKSIGLMSFLLSQHIGKQIEAFDITTVPPNIRQGNSTHTPSADLL